VSEHRGNEDRWRDALDAHESDRYAHAPILLELHVEMTELQKLSWQVRGGLIVLGAFIAGGLLVIVAKGVGVL
jgi:hypothetical protein